MVTISFLLKEPKAEKPTPIFAFVVFSGQRIKVYSGLSINPKQWLKADQRAQVRGYPDNGTLNDTLVLQEDQLRTCYQQCRATGLLPTAELLRAAIAPQPAPTLTEEPVLTFWDHYAEWTAVTKAKHKARSASVYETAGRHVRHFAAHTKRQVNYDTINAAWGDAFTGYLLQQTQLTDNTIAKQVSTFKRFLRWAAERGYHQNREYERLNWKRREPDIMTLTQEELAILEQLDLPLHSYLENARALFLLSCYTGLRYSDLVSIRPEHLKGHTLRLTTQKTREVVNIPLSASAFVLVQRYLAGGVRCITNQKLNMYLKELGQRADLTVPTEVIRYRAGERASSSVAKWERLGCHTGRRTFVTLSLERGMRPEIIMKITGHRDWKSFQRYVNITDAAVEREFSRAYAMPV